MTSKYKISYEYAFSTKLVPLIPPIEFSELYDKQLLELVDPSNKITEFVTNLSKVKNGVEFHTSTENATISAISDLTNLKVVELADASFLSAFTAILLTFIFLWFYIF